MELRGIPAGGLQPGIKAAYSTGGSKNFNQVLRKTRDKAAPYERFFQQAASQHRISPAVLKAVAEAESNFNPQAVSRSGAIGLMQFMPGTARSLGVNPYDAGQSIFGAAKYLRSLLNEFQGNLKLALAGYNAGPGAVKKYGGIPPYRETQNYVNRVIQLAAKYESGLPLQQNFKETKTTQSMGTGLPAVGDNYSALFLLWKEMLLLSAFARL
jgi:soluble lytic murein transglycosylase-like protein